MTRHKQMASWAARTMRQDESVRIALKEGICLANFATNARYEITRATIIIPVDYSRAKGPFSGLRGGRVEPGDGAAQRLGQGVPLHLQ